MKTRGPPMTATVPELRPSAAHAVALADNLIRWIEPVQAKRREFEAQPQRVWDILDSGSNQARTAARRTMKRVREAIFQSEEARSQSGKPAVKQAPEAT